MDYQKKRTTKPEKQQKRVSHSEKQEKQLIFMINLKLTKTQFIENHSNKKSD